MRDTPDYILAQVCIDAMAIFSEAIARRDEWHGFRKADEHTPEKQGSYNQADCEKCKYRLKCSNFLSKCSLNELIKFYNESKDLEEKSIINSMLKDVVENLNNSSNHEKWFDCPCIHELKELPKQALHIVRWDAKKYEKISILIALKELSKKE